MFVCVFFAQFPPISFNISEVSDCFIKFRFIKRDYIYPYVEIDFYADQQCFRLLINRIYYERISIQIQISIHMFCKSSLLSSGLQSVKSLIQLKHKVDEFNPYAYYTEKSDSKQMFKKSLN